MTNEKLPQEQAKNREQLDIGMMVDIVLKQDQKTMTLTRGKIQDFLTSKDFHPRGIKVRLQKEGVQRLYDTSPLSRKKDVLYQGSYKDEDYIGRVQRIYYPDNYGVLFVDRNGGLLEENVLSTFQKRYSENSCLIMDSETSINQEIQSLFLNSPKDTVDIILSQQSLILFVSHSQSLLTDYLSSINKKYNIYLLKEGRFLNV